MPVATELTELTLGLESEAFVGSRRRRGPTQLPTELNRCNGALRGATGGEITTDTGIDQVEFVTGVHTKPDVAVGELSDMLSALQHALPHTSVCFAPLRPDDLRFGPKVRMWVRKQRYDALFAAAKKEAPNGWEGLNQFPNVCATHMHVGVDPMTPEGVSLLNYFNNVGPWISRRVGRRFGIDNYGHLGVWRGWARKERFPRHSLWFSGPESLQDFVSSIPKFIVEDSNGIWRVAEESDGMSDIRSAVDTGTLWWLARPRGHQNTVEIRVLPSIRPEVLTEVATELHSVAKCVVEMARSGSPLLHRPLRGEKSRIFEACAALSKLVPNKPLTSGTWQSLFDR